ncbi:MAG: LysE family translocator [Alphaproteobacteria bacterium]|jgi:threonine/homoserine/homoserine lactone efflux protein|tara:strand:- start:242 stop:862 length:621 start_codon:yes stop_codon:yes gene_type:complete
MTIILFLKIFIVCLLGAMSPGPSMVVVINNAIFKNRFNGILTALGHGFGIGIYALCAVLGIGLIIETNMLIFNGIQSLSILFLFYLGIQSIRSNSELDFTGNEFTSGIKSFLQGLTISILNPKIFIWFIAIYSQFMSATNNLSLNVSLILIACIVDGLWYIILVNFVTSRNVFEFIKNKSKLMQKIIGFLFIFISIGLAVNMYTLS